MNSNLKKLSITDLKATKDFVSELSKERIKHKEEFDTGDTNIKILKKLEIEVFNELFSRINKLKI
jgi:hypothetical protein